LRGSIRHLSKQALIKRVHRALDKLEEKSLVITEIISTFRFARLTEKGLASIPDAVDLIAKNGGKTSAKELGLNERTVRYHLKKLKDDDIISNCRRGNRHFYHIHVSI